MSLSRVAGTPSAPSLVDLFTPKLVTVLREGYGLGALRADLLAALTVAVVALPLSMAIAIASGTTPERGLYAAIFGGFLVSALGGSRFQIGGPAGAFIVLVAATVQRHGVDGLLLATMMSGVFLAAAGLLRLGTYIKFIPYPVTVGFTAGIALIIFASQVRDLLGLAPGTSEPGALLHKVAAIVEALPQLNPAAVATAAATIGTILVMRRWLPRWPGMLIAVVAVSAVAAVLNLPVETIGSRFGGFPHTLPRPSLPAMDAARLMTVLPDALLFTLLGAIESLLSAVVADGMTGRRHRSNGELLAQGIANVGSAAFGGIPVTGTIARTATNGRAGAHGPVAGMLHSLALLLFLVVAAPLASFIPLAALAGVLAVVAWTMAERHAFATLLRASRGDALVVTTTFALTVFRDLATGILAGFLLGTLVFVRRMAQAIHIEPELPLPPGALDRSAPADQLGDGAEDRDVLVCRVSGAFFFGGAASIGLALERIGEQPKLLVLDFAAVPYLDSSAARVVASAADRLRKRGARLVVTGATAEVRDAFAAHGVAPPLVEFAPSVAAALPRHPA